MCRVLKHVRVGAGYCHLVLDAPRLAEAAQPGQFVHVRIPGLEASALRRPFSIFNAEDGRLELLYKVVGRGTQELARVAEGDDLDVMGPLGRGFPLSVAEEPLFVGGGYGVAPLFFLARLLKRGTLFVGGRTKEDLLALDRFGEIGIPVVAATNDGSFGEKGFVTVPLDAQIARLRQEGRGFALFVCGPDGLLKAAAERAAALHAPGFISMDRHMICGVGACYACVQKTVRGFSRCCLEGPVFNAEDLVW